MAAFANCTPVSNNVIVGNVSDPGNPDSIITASFLLCHAPPTLHVS
jgi:hypothetical protein